MVSLPQEFADLEPLCAVWAIGDEAARNRKRLASSMAELQDFYNALLPRMDAIIQHLNVRPLDSLAPGEQTLLDLALMFMEVAPAVEIYKDPDVPWGFAAERFHILPA
ncbi:hypothetical protein [Immundisolibacter sp.]|uniref:hypothetical protein n=1 Tax=Immundisolibacter sp. TaxID=1934948 RepID=UPI002614FEB4|nr:hypothetical protein [Immundisolibacter sp.]MDD3651131.1 hypothetical protein [Immundisolibacter sp.]